MNKIKVMFVLVFRGPVAIFASIRTRHDHPIWIELRRPGRCN